MSDKPDERSLTLENPIPVLLTLAGIIMVLAIGAIIFTIVVTAKHGIVHGDAAS
jgi:hypothetical protein